MTNSQVKAWTYTSTTGGLAQNLQLTNHQIPDTKPDHILIEVLNASINPGDYKFSDVRPIKWLIKQPASPCFDFCGHIRALPNNLEKDSRNLHINQVVFGMHRDLKTRGTLKTFLWVHKDTVYPLPDTIPAEHGSALGVAALTAYQAIAPHAKPNTKILINGGSGGVGTFCIQIAKALNLYIIATCSEAGTKLCLDLGANETLNYKSPTFHTDLHRTKVDLVIDNVGHDPTFHHLSPGFLNPDGIFILIAVMDYNWTGKLSMLESYLRPTWLGGVPRKWKFVFTQSAIEDYEAVAKMAGEGKLRVVVDSVFPFGDVPGAFARVVSGRAKGKVLVDMVGS